MWLHDIVNIIQVALARDAAFDSLGVVTQKNQKMLVFIEDKKYLRDCINNPHITCVITTEELADSMPKQYGLAISGNPRRAFYEIHNYLVKDTHFYGDDFQSEVSASAFVHPRAYVASRCVRIGNNSVIEPGAMVLENSIIGENVIIGTGSVIGSRALEYKRFGNTLFRVLHAGGVRIGDNVEILSNSVLCRSVFGGYTEVGKDTKIDNMVYIAHNAIIGERCFIIGNAMIAGSVTIGNDVWIGPGALISNQLTIGDGACITMGSVVTRSVDAGQRVTGNFAISHDKFLKNLRMIR